MDSEVIFGVATIGGAAYSLSRDVNQTCRWPTAALFGRPARRLQAPILSRHLKGQCMKQLPTFATATAVVATVVCAMTFSAGRADDDISPIYGIKIPSGYRDWRLISVKRLTGAEGKLNQLRAQLGNDIAIAAFREGKLPFPDGAIIAALHWNEDSSVSDNQVLATGFPGLGLESTFAGSGVNVQFMVKDSKKYAASGGWGYADFTNGKPGDQALHEKCFPCHLPAKDRDYVFTHYAATP
jgi:hypothetical protein